MTTIPFEVRNRFTGEVQRSIMKPTVTWSPTPFSTVRVYDRTRDEFAMAALTGLVAARSYHGAIEASVYASDAYILADAMLKQREAS